MSEFCFCVLSLGDRYYPQTKRFIEDRNNNCPQIPINILTDNIKYFEGFEKINIFNIGDFGYEYLNYKKNYYGFDFSIIRFLIRKTLELGYLKFVVLDNDNHFVKTFNLEKFKNLFKINHILSPIVYNFGCQVDMGKKVLFYSKFFNYNIEESEILKMPEGSVNLYWFDSIDRGLSFVNDFDKCINIRNENKLFTNDSIQEKFFSGFKNKMMFDNCIIHTFFQAKHDKWYM